MDGLIQDLRYGLRQLGRNPGFTLVAVLTLGLGLGAATAIWSVVYGVLLRPLPYPEPERIVQVWQINERGGRTSVSDPNFAEWREWSRSFRALAQFSAQQVTVTGGAEPARVMAAAVSRDFFPAMGAAPILGRGFAEDDLVVGGAPGVIVSEGFWRRHLDGATDFTALRLEFYGRSNQVVGVMPACFAFPFGAELWVPREQFPRLPSRTAHNWQVIGRLAGGATLEQAQAEMTAIARRQKEMYGDDTWHVDAAVVPLAEQLTGHTRPALLALLGAVGFLLLVACANVAGLLLARGAARQRELAVRAALGASRGRLVRQLLTESLLLALAGGAAGVVLAAFGVEALLALEPGRLPRTGDVAVDWPVLAFVLLLAVVVAAALGTLAALRMSGGLTNALAEGGRSGIGGGEGVRRVLVAAQIALTLVLLVGAGLLGRSFLRLVETDPGFRTEGLVVMDLTHPQPSGLEGYARIARTHEELLARLAAAPGVTAAGGVNSFPFYPGGADGMFLILPPGERMDTMDDLLKNFERLARNPDYTGYADFRIASGDYFRAAGIPLVAGRLFDERDGPDAPHVALISESLARERWPGRDPIGARIQYGNMDGDVRMFTIVGVVGDVRERGMDAAPRATFYGEYRQRPRVTGHFQVAVAGTLPAVQLISLARTELARVAPDVPPQFRTIEEVVAGSLADRRFPLLLLGVFGAVALALAVVGVASLAAWAVARRRREIGVRMALGASPGEVVRMIVRQGARLVAVGAVVGVVAAVALTRLLEGMLYGVRATDPLSFAAAAALLVVVALAACWAPARRAASIHPSEALRHE
jgi:putative ABC transport system permease protein